MKKFLLYNFVICLSFISFELIAQNEVQVFVFEDENGDGIQDALDPGIPGVSMADLVLYYDLNMNGLPDAAPTDVIINHDGGDGAGTYTFSDLTNMPDGDYILGYTETPGSYHITLLNAGAPATDSDLDPTTGFSIAFPLSGGTEMDIDLGLYLASSIGDFVWEDVNGNGNQDGGEPGIPGLNVTLLDGITNAVITMDANGPIAANPVTTAGGGVYNFPNLIPGTYKVEFSAPLPIGGVNWFTTETVDTDPADGMTDSDADPADMLRSHAIVLESDEIENKIDAGFWLPAKIGNMVFCDRNGNGIHEPAATDPEDGRDGVTVNLLFSGGPNDNTPAIDANGVAFPPQTTAGGGFYEFDLVPPGEYKLRFEFNATVTDPPYRFTFFDVAGSTDDNDSDVIDDPALVDYGETRTITITSQDIEEETRWDAGVYRLVDITGTIWFDAGMDQMNNGEAGPGDVLMVLTETNGVYPPVNGSSGMNGEYEFLGIPPGLYTLTITSAAFAPGGSLAGTSSCVGFINADIMNDNDDNGPDTGPGDIITTQFPVISNCNDGPPPTIEYIDFCFEFDCGAQNSISAGACDEVVPINTICDVPTLEAFCNLMPTNTSTGNQPSPLCPSGGAAHNISWFAFVAYEGNYSVTVTPVGCTDAGGYSGVQIGLYTSCQFDETVYCNPVCSEDPVTFESDGSGLNQDEPLVPGQTYYFFIDGCAGSICSYDVEIIGSPSPSVINAIDMCIVDDTATPDCTLDNVVYCPGVDVAFQVQGVDLTVDYTWSVNTNSGGPFIGDSAPVTSEENLLLNFINIGEYEICIDRIENGCSIATWTGPICKTVLIEVIPDEDFSDQTICLEDLATFNYDVFDPEDPNSDGNLGWLASEPTPAFGTLTGTVDIDGCMFEQEFDLLQHPISDVELVESTVCRGDLPLTIDGISYNELAFGGELTFSIPMLQASVPNQYSCDSFINIELEILDIFGGTITPDICTPDGLILNFAYDPSLSTDIGFITWEWTGPSGNVLLDDNPGDIFDIVIPTDTGNGTYALTATIIKNGVTCLVPITIDIDFDQLLPPTPIITGSPLLICESDSVQTYTTSASDVNIYNWTVTGGASILSGGGITDETIEVNWGSSNSGGSISLTVEGCGVSDLATLDVALIPLLTPDFTVTAEVCRDSSTIITYSGPTDDIDSYTWDFDGGIVNNATGGNGPGPHEVSWADGGIDHDITLTVMHNGGCTSTETVEIVSTIEPLTPPVVNCNPNTGEVSFTWADVAGSTGYDVDVTSVDLNGDPHVGVIDGTTFTVTGLEDGETVTINLIVMTGDACQMVIGTAPGCTSQDCVAPTIALDAGNGPGTIVSLCTADIVGNIDISSAITSGEQGTGEFTGPGIIDAVAGTFDPTQANNGINTITYLFMTNDPVPCIGNQTIQIEVLETPTASFLTSADTVCITEAVSLTYDGTAGINTSDYTVTDGQTFNQSEPIITFTQTGEQTISLTVVSDGCESSVFTRTVFVQPELEPITVSCSSTGISFVEFIWNDVTGSTGYEVVVTNADGSVDPAFTTTNTTYMQSGLNPGDIISITVTVLTDSRCLGSSDSEMCTATACPTFTFEYDNETQDVCADGTTTPITLQALASGGDGTGTYTWSGSGNLTGDQFDPNGLPEGAVTLFVSYNENGCEGTGSVIVNVTQRPIASFDVAPDPICVGSTLPFMFTGSSLSGQTIDWSGSDVTVTATANPNEYEATFNTAGAFDLVLNVANGTDCNAIPAMATVVVEDELEFGTVDCSPTETEISFSWGNVDCATDYEVFLTIGTGAEMSQGIQSTTTYVADNLPEGTNVEIRVVAISDCACGDVMMTRSCETSACLQVLLDVSVMGGQTDFCFAPDLATVDVLANLTDNTGDGSGEYSGTGIDPVTGTFDPAAAGVGSHTIQYAWTEPFGCEIFMDSVTFNIFENPEITATADPIECYDDSLTILSIVPTLGDGNYTITSGGVDLPLMSEVTEGIFDIIVMDGNNCLAETSVTVTVPAEPMPEITGSEELIEGETSNYSIEQSIFTGLSIDSIVWTANGEGVCNDIGCFSLSNQAPIINTTYEVTVFYNNGCSVDASIVVEVTETEPIYTVDIPNIMSPNNDGANDEWFIASGDPEVMVNEVRIMDRWGNLVFEITEPYSPLNETITWDGKFGTNELQPGVYVYTVMYFQDGRDRVRNGDITIIR